MNIKKYFSLPSSSLKHFDEFMTPRSPLKYKLGGITSSYIVLYFYRNHNACLQIY
jgi:hypothetical protein